MTAFSQIEASPTEPTIAAVAAAIVKQVTAVGEGRTGFGLEAQITALDAAGARLKSVAAANYFACQYRIEDGEDQLGAYFAEGDPMANDDRPTQFAWSDDENGLVHLGGMIVDPSAEYDEAVIWPRFTCVAAFGKSRVLAWENAETVRRQERKAAQWG